MSAAKSDPSVELAALRKRVGRMEIGALVERGVILYLLYLCRDRIDELVMVAGGSLLALLAAFAVIERVRSTS